MDTYNPLAPNEGQAYGKSPDGSASGTLLNVINGIANAAGTVAKGIADVKAASKGGNALNPTNTALDAQNPTLKSQVESNPALKYALYIGGGILALGAIYLVAKSASK